jgi:DNA-binding CsgD family transcriptional regulator
MYEVIAATGEPLLVLQLPDERIVLATDSARSLLAPHGADPVGRTLPEFLDAPIGTAGELLARGQLTGCRLYRRRTDAPDDLEIWLSAEAAAAELGDRSDGAGSRPVLALLCRAGDGLRWATAQDGAQPPATMIGWTDRQLLVQQLGGDAASMLDRPVAEAVGRSLLDLVDPADLADLFVALGQLAGGRETVSLAVRLARPDSSKTRCQLILVPLGRSPACAFALQAPAASSADPLLPLRRLGQGIAAAGSAPGSSIDRARSALPELTSRELQIVDRLLAGDRVPAISRQLYLAQSTVRNHLSAVFAKLGVRSQQELIVLLRRAQSGSD